MKKDMSLYEAIALQEEGKIEEAEAAFKKILKRSPKDFVSLYSLGVISYKKNEYKKAMELFNKAKQVNSTYAPLWYNIGVTQQKMGCYADAVSSLQRSIKIDPSYKPAHNHLKTYLEVSGVTPKIIDDKGQRRAEVLSQALALQGEGRLDEAETLFKSLLSEDVNHVGALYSLGVLESQRQNPVKALEYIDKALDFAAEYAPLWYNKAVTLQSLKKFENALECYNKAIDINPEYIEALINRGAMLVEMKRHKDALMDYERLLAIEPNNEKVLSNRGIILSDFKLYDKSIETFNRLVSIAPDYEYALGLLVFAKLHACEWGGLNELYQRIIAGIKDGKRVCKSQALLAISHEPMDHLLCAKIFANHYYPAQKPIWNGESYNHRKIRIAYISPDFREHPVGHLTAGIFEQHDREKFEITAISLGIDDNSSLRKRMLAAFDKFIDVRQMSSREIAVMMKDMEIDIAVDLGGYTADTRTDILAYRPAPIQVNFLGYSSTMGAEYIDYIIADRVVIPEEMQDCYSEKTAYMPDCYLPTDASVKIAEQLPSREHYGLPHSGFVFCSFNHDYKINPPVFEIWMRLLKQVPGSVLWLMKLNEFAELNLLKEAEARGVAAERIVFATRVPKIEDHLARYQLADLFLDTCPYNAHTTTSDVLRAGLPVVTCMGKAFAGRVAASLLMTIGLPELVTNTLREYEDLALRLANSPEMLGDIKSRLKANIGSSPLYDTLRYCRNLELVYAEMCTLLQTGQEPKSFEINKKTTLDGQAKDADNSTKPRLAIVIPVYKERLDEQEQFAVDLLLKKAPGRGIFFIAPESLNKSYYLNRYASIDFRTFPDKNFESIIGYNHLLLDVAFYKKFDEYDYILIHQTDALLFKDDLDYWMQRNYDYIGAPWPQGVEINLKVGKFCVGSGVNLKAYVGNGGFSLRSVSSTIALLHEFQEIKDYWIKCGSSEDLFFAFMGMVSDSYVIPNQMVASRFSLELEPDKYSRMNNDEIPMGCHAWQKHDIGFWKNTISKME